MHIQRRWWIATFCILLIADALIFTFLILSRPVMTEEQWAFLEKQRPSFARPGFSEMVICADCLDYALARRPIGGWDGSAQLVELINAPSSFAARHVFDTRQAEGFGSSKSNSDLATLIFVVGATLECVMIATVVSIRFRRNAQ